MNKLMVIAIVALIGLSSCKKKESEVTPAKEIKSYTLKVAYKSGCTGYTSLSVNGNTINTNLAIGVTVNTDDKIVLENSGQDSWSQSSPGVYNVKHEGYVGLTLYLDSKPVYDVSCNCDANKTYIVE